MAVGDVTKFVKDFKAGSLKPHLKSESLPEVETEDGLTTIVGSTWDRIVNDPKKEVLVEYYVSWCAHCMALAHTYAELATEVEEIGDLVIAKMNYVDNEVAGLHVRQYPTIKFYPKDNKQGVLYEADKTLQDFKNWLNENSPAYRAANPNHKAENDAVNDEL